MTMPNRAVPVDAGHAVDAVGGALVVAFGGLLYLDFFAGRAFLLGFVVTVVAGTATGALAAVRRWSVARALGAAVSGYLVVAVPMLPDTLHKGLPTFRTAQELGLGVASGWAKMLSVGLPATMNDQMLVTVLLIGWTAAVTTTMFALRTAAPLWPALPPVVAFAIGLVMVATQPGTHFRLTAALLVVLVAMTFWRARRNTRTAVRGSSAPTNSRRGAVIAAASALAAVAVVGALFGARAGVLGNGSRRADPRPLETQRVLTPDYLTPLATVQPQVKLSPPEHLFDVSLRGGDADLPGMAVAVLDDFDGTTWTTTDEFLAAGQRLAVDRTLVQPRSVTAHVTVAHLMSAFLPEADWPVRLTFTSGPPVDVGFSVVSGSLLASDTVTAGSAYDVTGEYRPATDLTRRAQPDLADDDDRALPAGLPPYIDLLAHRLTDVDRTPVGKLAALNTFLRGLPYDVDAAPGHSYAAITRVLAAQVPTDDGDAEQHAAAFAVMARDLGYPARVVVGYRLVDGSGGTFEVTTRDATAWAEVHFVGYGWVAYDPTDVNRTQRLSPPIAGSTPSPTQQPVNHASIPQPSATVVSPPPVRPPSTSVDALRIVVVCLLSCGSVPVLCAFGVLVVKLRRRRRRRHARDNAARVVGAWEESVDRLTEVKVPLVLSMTPHEFAHHATRTLGDRAGAVLLLSTPVTAAIFAPRETCADDVSAAWRIERALRRDLHPGWRRISGLLAWLNPRPLVARRRAAGPHRRGRTTS